MEDREPDVTPEKPGRRPRRMRTARACEACKARKNRCDDHHPCGFCRQHNIRCVVKGQTAVAPKYTDDYVRGLEEQVKRLSNLVVDGPKHTPGRSPSHELALDFTSAPHEMSHDGMSPITHSDSKDEVSGLNQHTKNVEFYGSSSSVAMLSRVQQDEGDIVSSLHNPASPVSHHDSERVPSLSRNTWHAPQCRTFLLNFFATLHHVHPILDKARFLGQCEKLWSSGDEEDALQPSFQALYYSVSSLGALVGPRDDDPIDGVCNVEWSRALFSKAVRLCHQLGMVTDLEMVQCYFFMAKVCQNEITPHLSYMYVGLACRTALAMGINREPARGQVGKDSLYLRAEARTWWTLYSLEVELSFATGRPDTLGSDLYHTRKLYPVLEATNGPVPMLEGFDPAYCMIVGVMVDLARIVKKIGLEMYASKTAAANIVSLAFLLHSDLERWVGRVPTVIRPRHNIKELMSLKNVRDPVWAKRQRLVLTLRHLNLIVLTFGPILLCSGSSTEASVMAESPTAQNGVRLCLKAAKNTIDIIHTMYQHQDFFRTWHYNTTYTNFAASMILVYAKKTADGDEVQPLLEFVQKAIEVLETMDDCAVAHRCAVVFRKALDKFAATSGNETGGGEAAGVVADMAAAPQSPVHLSWGPMNFINDDLDLNLPFELDDLHSLGF